MLFKKVFRYIKSMFRRPMYYNKEYGWYIIDSINLRTDYWKEDAFIKTNDGIWHKVPHVWLINNSVDENGNSVKI